MKETMKGINSEDSTDYLWTRIKSYINSRLMAVTSYINQQISARTVQIPEGGTGAVTAEEALANLGVADYIIEQGTSGIWTYRKWASGIAECWGQVASTKYNLGQSLPYGRYTTLSNLATFPTGLFNAKPKVYADAVNDSTGVGMCSPHAITTTTFSCRLWQPYSSTIAWDGTIDIIARGTWK